MNDRIMELDYALREALQARDSDAVLHLTDAYLRLVEQVMAVDGGEARERFARQVGELVSRNIELAVRIRDDLRADLRTVLTQRQLAGGGATANEAGTPTRCSYCV